MRIGQKVRLLKDNSIVAITDSTFFKLDGQKHIRYQVKTKCKNRCWYPAEELAPVTEQVKVTMSSEDGKELLAKLEFNHDKQKLNINLTGNPVNLKEHSGLHVRLMSILIDRLAGDDKNLNKKVQYKQQKL